MCGTLRREQQYFLADLHSPNAGCTDAGLPSLLFLTASRGGSRQAWLLFLLFLDSFIDLFPVYRDIPRGVDTEAHLSTLHVENRDIDVVANLEGFADPAGQYEHRCGSLWDEVVQFALPALGPMGYPRVGRFRSTSPIDDLSIVYVLSGDAIVPWREPALRGAA